MVHSADFTCDTPFRDPATRWGPPAAHEKYTPQFCREALHPNNWVVLYRRTAGSCSPLLQGAPFLLLFTVASTLLWENKLALHVGGRGKTERAPQSVASLRS